MCAGLACAVLLTGCDAEEDASPPEPTPVDAAIDGTIDPDAAVDATVDAAPGSDAAIDMIIDRGPPDQGMVDMAQPDLTAPDMQVSADQGMPADDMGMGDGSMGDGSMGDDGGMADMDMPPPGVCVGPDTADPPAYPAPIDDCGVSCVGAPTPVWSLADFQPQSCGFEQTYGLNTFQGRVTLFATFNAGCGFCQAQAEGLEQMRLELEFAGHPVWFVALNSASNLPHAERLIERCSFPLMQDTEELNVWDLQNGGVSDFYIYDVDGRLVRHYDQTEERAERGRSLTLSNDEDYDELKQAIIDALP
jgi:hypothetical protein